MGRAGCVTAHCRAGAATGAGPWQAARQDELRSLGSALCRGDTWQQKAAMPMKDEPLAQAALSTRRFVALLRSVSKVATVSVGQLRFYQGDLTS